MPTLASLLLLAIVAQAMRRRPGIAARVARSAGPRPRARALYGWALGTAVTFLVPALVALVLMGRVDALWTMPPELARSARSLGLAPASGADLSWLLGSLALGAMIGIAIVMVRRWRGKAPLPTIYRSSAAVRARDEWGGAAAIALAAGVGEELFFRLALPLALGLSLGHMDWGLALSAAAFAAVHRHQGWRGVVATGLVGAGLACLYLSTGALWLVVLLHVAVDLNALILRPWLDRAARPA